MLNRRESREAVFCMVYELDFNKECDIDTLFENAIEERSIENNGYIKETFYGVAGKLGEIDEMIKNKSVYQRSVWRRCACAHMRSCTRTFPITLR